jgi:hypothetical protein
VIVECVRGEPDAAEMALMGFGPRSHLALFLTPGKRYVVLGLSMFLEDQTVWIDVSEDGDDITSALLSMFKVVDPRPSALWTLRLGENRFDLWPAAFYEPYFHERLGEQEPEAVAAFAPAFAHLTRESDEPGD